MASVTTNYATNFLNQYTAIGGSSLTYDANGNLTQKTDGGVTTTYNYDLQNRLVGVSSPGESWATYGFAAGLSNFASSIATLSLMSV